MICVLKVVQGPAVGRKCWLKRDQSVTIGRIANADFAIPADAHMSRNHLIVEGVKSIFRLRDVGSSNGTFVNDFPVSVVELCSGDRIKAGSSVFEVELESGEELPAGYSASDDQLLESVPNRTLSSGELEEAIEELTMRYAPQVDETTMYVHPQQSLASPLASPASPVIAPASPGVASGLSAASLAFLTDEFSPPQENGVWRQRETGDRRAPERILEKVIQNELPAHYSLIVNRLQIEGAEKGALDFYLSTRDSRLLTETLCIIENRKPGNVVEFYKRCLRNDAAICIVSAEPLTSEWLQQAIDTLSYPSLLADVVNRSASRGQELASTVYFILYEPNTGNELQMLSRSLQPSVSRGQ